MLVAVSGAAAQSPTAVPTQGGPTPPNRFYGNVTLDGKPAPDGTPVVAMVGANVCGRTTALSVVSTSTYVVDVDSNYTRPGCGVEGAQIVFMIGNARATQTGTFATGIFTKLDLAAQAATPTATPTPVRTATPAPTTAPTVVRTPAAAPTAARTPTAAPTAARTPTAAPTAVRTPTTAPATQRPAGTPAAQRPAGSAPGVAAPAAPAAAAPAGTGAGAATAAQTLPRTGTSGAADGATGAVSALAALAAAAAGLAMARRRR
jgi:hypothetical protein